MYSVSTEIYNQIFVEYYSEFLSFCKDEDRLQHIYVKIYTLIENKTLKFITETEPALKYKLKNYIKVSIYNDWKKDERLKKHSVQVNDVKIKTVVEHILYMEDYNDELSNEIDEINMWVSQKLFEYLKTHYTETENYVFVTYFLHDKKRISYSKLAKLTGFSESKVCNIIQKMKKDLQENLENHINTQ